MEPPHVVGFTLSLLQATHFPLWVSPMEASFLAPGLTESPSLKIQWCLNAECVSPAFLGAGSDVRFGFGQELKADAVPGLTPSTTPRTTAFKTTRAARELHSDGATSPTKKVVQPAVLGTLLEIGNSGSQNSEMRTGMLFDLEFFTRGSHPRQVLAEYTSKITAMKERPGPSETIAAGVGPRSMVDVEQEPALVDNNPPVVFSQAAPAAHSPAAAAHEKMLASLPQRDPRLPHIARLLKVRAYPLQVVSIMPPLMLQSRAAFQECSETLGADFSAHMLRYFSSQLAKKCGASQHHASQAFSTGKTSTSAVPSSYDCLFPEMVDHHRDPHSSGFACVEQSAPGSMIRSGSGEAQYWGRKPVPYGGNNFFPEFLDTMTVPLVFRGGEMSKRSSYVDRQTRELILIDAFLAPDSAVGTVLEVYGANGFSVLSVGVKSCEGGGGGRRRGVGEIM